MVLLFSLILASSLATSNSNFFVISDLHYDIFYKENYNNTYFCHEQGSRLNKLAPKPTSDLKSIGRVGCDSPKALIDLTMKKLVEIDSDPDFILITGDIIAHFTSETLTPEGVYDSDYSKEMIIQSFQDVHEIIREYFPTTPLYPVIGNNDAYEDYIILWGSEETEFLKKISDIFTDLPSSFNEKGYYSVNPSYEIIALNSNYYSIKQVAHRKVAEMQLEWLDKILLQSKGSVIIAMHIPPGLNRYKFGDLSWHNGYAEEFLKIVEYHKDKISFIFAGHFHSTAFQLIDSTGILIHRAVSPIYANNPGIRYYFSESQKKDFIDYTLDLTSQDPQWLVEVQHSDFFSTEQIYLTKDYQLLKSDSKKIEEYLMHCYGLGNSDTTLQQLWRIAFRASYDTKKDQGIKATLCAIEFIRALEFSECLYF